MLISLGIVFLTNLKNGNEINGPKVKSDRLLGGRLLLTLQADAWETLDQIHALPVWWARPPGLPYSTPGSGSMQLRTTLARIWTGARDSLLPGPIERKIFADMTRARNQIERGYHVLLERNRRAQGKGATLAACPYPKSPPRLPPGLT